MSKIMFIKETKTFLDGSVLWVELEDPETGEIKRLSGKELDEWRKTKQEKGSSLGQNEPNEEC